MTLFIQFSNPITATGVCRIISCILHNHHLDDAGFDLKPSCCAHHDAWLREGLPELSDDMLGRDWSDVVPFLRREKVCGCQQAHSNYHITRHDRIESYVTIDLHVTSSLLSTDP